MLSQQQLLDLGLAPDKASLQRHLTKAAQDLGFGLFSAVLVRGALDTGRAWLEAVGNPPDAYVDATNSLDDTLRDPVMSALRRGVRPVLYDQALYADAGASDLWDLQAPFGYKSGVACVVHESSHLEQFMLGVDGDALPKDLVGRMRLTAAVQLLTVHAQAAMQRICTPQPSGSPELDADELACLQWAREGYIVRQVGDKLVMSDVDVIRHQRSAVRKVGASTVSGAILRCIQGGLID
jgi:hypothetical protein